jgi:hypothetical protein
MEFEEISLNILSESPFFKTTFAKIHILFSWAKGILASFRKAEILRQKKLNFSENIRQATDSNYKYIFPVSCSIVLHITTGTRQPLVRPGCS